MKALTALVPLDGSRLSKHAFMLLLLLSLIGFEKVIYSRWLPGFRVFVTEVARGTNSPWWEASLSREEQRPAT
jgi:hypothetical protein